MNITPNPRAKILFVALLMLGSTQAQTALKTLKIATFSPLSGPQAQAGEQLKLGVQLALELAKPEFARLGYALELSAQDDTASPEVGGTIARRLLSDPEVLAVVGGLNSGVTIVASNIFAEDNLAMIAPATTANAITERGLSNVSRIAARDTQQGYIGGRFLVSNLHAKTVYLINDKTAYGSGLTLEVEKYLRSKNITIVANEGTEEKLEFTPLIIKIKALNPQVIYFGGIYTQIGVFLKQLRGAGIQTPVMGGHGLDSKGLATIAGEASKGTYFTTVAAPKNEMPRAANFFAKYKTAFGKDADGYGAVAFDAANVELAALRTLIKAGQPLSRKAVSSQIRSSNLEGLTGNLRFDSKGDRIHPKMYVMQYTDTLEPKLLERFNAPNK
jgi:branched-chain amino acid transport system substrate-binding protein